MKIGGEERLGAESRSAPCAAGPEGSEGWRSKLERETGWEGNERGEEGVKGQKRRDDRGSSELSIHHSGVQLAYFFIG